jgi:hypothetical protein
MHEYAPITRAMFSTKSWQRPAALSFARQNNLIPVVAAELSEIVPILPLAFAKNADTFQLVAVTSVLPGMNLFIGPDGQWLGRYVPAALRGYPFKVLRENTTHTDLLCIDTQSNCIVSDQTGLPFYDEDGQLSGPLKEILALITQIEDSRVLTERGVHALSKADMIEPWAIDVIIDGKALRTEGLYRINETRLLRDLSDENFLALRDAGALPIAYAQLISMSQIANLKRAEELQKTLLKQADHLQNAANSIAPLFGPGAPDKLQFN